MVLGVPLLLRLRRRVLLGWPSLSAAACAASSSVAKVPKYSPQTMACHGLPWRERQVTLMYLEAGIPVTQATFGGSGPAIGDSIKSQHVHAKLTC